MLTNELKDKLTETLAICEIHHQRMMFAFESVNNIFHCLNRSVDIPVFKTAGQYGGPSV